MSLEIYNKFKSIPDIEKFQNYIPVFATQKYANYLQELNGSKTIWFVLNSCLIPLSIMKKGPFKKGTFQTSVITANEVVEIKGEQLFLNTIIDYIKINNLCDWIQQGPNWAIFNTYPDGAVFAPFGTYRIDFKDKSEIQLLANLYTKVRGRIRKLYKNKEVKIIDIFDSVEDSINLINDTLKASNVDTFNLDKFNLIKKHLGENILGFTTYSNDIPQSSFIYFFNSYSVYGIYAGSKSRAVQGATEIINWEIIKECKRKGLKYFDAVGARINPEKDSKLYRIQRGKAHLGTELKEGFIWKVIINKQKYFIYSIYVQLMNLFKGKKNKGDIIDQERKRLNIQ